MNLPNQIKQIKSNGLFCFAAQMMDYYTRKIQQRLVDTYTDIKLVKKRINIHRLSEHRQTTVLFLLPYDYTKLFRA